MGNCCFGFGVEYLVCKDQSWTSVYSSATTAGRERVCGTELCSVREDCCLSRSDMYCSAPANKNNYNQYLNLGMVAWLFYFWDYFTNLAGNSYKKNNNLTIKKGPIE